MLNLWYAIAYERGFQRWLSQSHVSAANLDMARRWYAVNRLRHVF
jgi:hypothetical protein